MHKCTQTQSLPLSFKTHSFYNTHSHTRSHFPLTHTPSFSLPHTRTRTHSLTHSHSLTRSLSPSTHTVRARGKPSQEALKNILALEQSMPKVYKKIQAAESAPPPNKSQKGSSQPSSSNLNNTSAPPETVSSGNSRFGNYTI
jgi:hypothetical protein